MDASKKLFRLKLVDDIAQRDVIARGAAFTEQSEVILAYRIKLADRLALPVKSRSMLFSQTADVSEAAIDEAYTEVLRVETASSDKVAFLVKQAFWIRHLRKRHANELNSYLAPGTRLLEEKSDALFELSRLQKGLSADADQVTRDAWLAKRDEAVDTVGLLLGMRRNEILVDGSMQSGFYDAQMRALHVAQNEHENLGLTLLTQKVLNNHAAQQGTPL